MARAYKDRVCEDDIWALWPNDFMCPRFEIDEHITRGGCSDDYELVVVTKYDETDGPCEWQPYKRWRGEEQP